MKILAIEKAGGEFSASYFKPYLESEAQKVWDMMQEGVIRETYFTEDHDAVLILECQSTQEAEKYLEQLPLVKQKLIYFEIKELRPYDGFFRLFK